MHQIAETITNPGRFIISDNPPHRPIRKRTNLNRVGILWQFFGMIAFAFACWGTGELLRRTFFGGSSCLSSIAQHILAFAAGNAVFSYLLTVFGFSGLFSPVVFWGLLSAGIGLGVWQMVAPSQQRSSDTLGKGINDLGENLPVISEGEGRR